MNTRNQLNWHVQGRTFWNMIFYFLFTKLPQITLITSSNSSNFLQSFLFIYFWKSIVTIIIYELFTDD